MLKRVPFRLFIYAVALLFAFSIVHAQTAAPTALVTANPVIVATAKGVTIPADLTAGITTLIFRNETEAWIAPDIGRFNEGKSMKDLMDALQNNDFVGAMATVTLLGGPYVEPAKERNATYNLAAGDYLFEASVGTGGPPILMPFTVAKDVNATATPPQKTIAVSMVDFSFAMPDSVASTVQQWEITNLGKQMHEMVIFKVNEDAKLPDITKALIDAVKATKPGEITKYPYPTAYAWGGMSPGATAWPEMALDVGTYVAVCFAPDTDSKENVMHLEHGMIRLFTVTK